MPGRILLRTTPDGSQAPVDAVKIDSAQNVTVSAGNLVIGTSGKGIDFSATPGTGTSELLADYEEGTWTPAFTFTTPGDFALGTPIVQAGKYTKVGRQVTCNFTLVTTPTWTTASSFLVLTGLPFTVTATAGPGFGPVSFTNVTKANYTSYALEAESSNTRCYLTGSSNTGLAGYSIQAADMVSGTQTVLAGSVTYTV
jgi:hypothetical protein